MRQFKTVAICGGQSFCLGQRIFQRPHHQGQRRAKLVADVGEELRLELIELRQFLALARNLALMRLLFGDVASLGGR